MVLTRLKNKSGIPDRESSRVPLNTLKLPPDQKPPRSTGPVKPRPHLYWSRKNEKKQTPNSDSQGSTFAATSRSTRPLRTLIQSAAPIIQQQKPTHTNSEITLLHFRLSPTNNLGAGYYLMTGGLELRFCEWMPITTILDCTDSYLHHPITTHLKNGAGRHTRPFAERYGA